MNALMDRLGGPEVYSAIHRAAREQLARELRDICPDASEDLIADRSAEILTRLIGASTAAGLDASAQ